MSKLLESPSAFGYRTIRPLYDAFELPYDVMEMFASLAIASAPTSAHFALPFSACSLSQAIRPIWGTSLR